MREIKFRVYHNTQKRFITDEVFILANGTIDWLYNVLPRINQDEVIIQQYTGLKDKNGVEITDE